MAFQTINAGQTYPFLFIAPAISCNWDFLVPDSWEDFLFNTADPGSLMSAGTATVLWNWETASCRPKKNDRICNDLVLIQFGDLFLTLGIHIPLYKTV